MAAHQHKASLYATPPSGGVRFVFFAIPTGLGLRVFAFFAHTGRSLSRLQHGLFFAASPYGEALKFRSLESSRALARRTFTS